MKLIMENWRKHLKEARAIGAEDRNAVIYEKAGLNDEERDFITKLLQTDQAYMETPMGVVDNAMDKLREYFGVTVREEYDLDSRAPGSQAEVENWLPTWVWSDGDDYPWILDRLRGGVDMRIYWQGPSVQQYLQNYESEESDRDPFTMFRGN